MLRKRPSGVWHVDFQLFGKRIHRSAQTTCRRTAQQFEARLRHELAGARSAPEARAATCTVREAVDRYVVEHLTPNARRPERLPDEACVFDRLIDRIGGPSTLLDQIDSARVAKLKGELLAAGLAKATVNRYLAMLRAVLRKASIEWQVKTTSPVFKLYRLDNARTRSLSADEERRLFDDLERFNPHLLRLVRFLLATGARLGEALRLRWTDVHVDGGDGHRGFAVFPLTKNGQTRSVPLTNDVAAMLLEMRATAVTDKVFVCAYSGRGVQPYSQPHSGFANALRRARIDDLRIHDLRHTFASRLVARGVSLYKVGALLGHKDPRMTARYAHLAPSDLDDVVALLDSTNPGQPPAPSGPAS